MRNISSENFGKRKLERSEARASRRRAAADPDATRARSFVGSPLLGKVHAIREKDAKREVKAVASDQHRPNGIAPPNGALYFAELSNVWHYDNIEAYRQPAETSPGQRPIS